MTWFWLQNQRSSLRCCSSALRWEGLLMMSLSLGCVCEETCLVVKGRCSWYFDDSVWRFFAQYFSYNEFSCCFLSVLSVLVQFSSKSLSFIVTWGGSHFIRCLSHALLMSRHAQQNNVLLDHEHITLLWVVSLCVSHSMWLSFLLLILCHGVVVCHFGVYSSSCLFLNCCHFLGSLGERFTVPFLPFACLILLLWVWATNRRDDCRESNENDIDCNSPLISKVLVIQDINVV